jgi:hypothetical protein
MGIKQAPGILWQMLYLQYYLITGIILAAIPAHQQHYFLLF